MSGQQMEVKEIQHYPRTKGTIRKKFTLSLSNKRELQTEAHQPNMDRKFSAEL